MNSAQDRLLAALLLVSFLGVHLSRAQNLQPAATPVLTIDEAVEIALREHPALPTSEARVRASEGLLKQGSLRPNPTLFLQTENWRFTGEPGFDAGSELDLFAFVSQPWERGGKRARRIANARVGQDLARLERESLRWQIGQSVKAAFVAALRADDRVRLLVSNQENFRQFVEYHELRVREGAMAEADLIRVRLEMERLRLELQQADLDREQAQMSLRLAMGFPPDRDFGLTPLGTRQRPAHTEAALLEMARNSRPDLLLARMQLEQARTQADLARSNASADWNIVLGYKRTDDRNTLIGGVNIPLPFFNRNQGNVLYGLAEIDRRESELKAVWQRALSEIHAAVEEVRRRRGMLTRLEKETLGQAEESSRIALAAYRENALDLLRFLDAQRTLNEIRLLRSVTRYDYERSLLKLESSVGVESIDILEK